jgi:MYXO-CTERM domain-containing protein
LCVQANAQIYSVDFTTDDGGYTVTNVGNIQNQWTWAAGEGWQVNGNEGGDNSADNVSKLTSPVLTIPIDGMLEVSVDHRYSFEVDWDAGAVFASVNGSEFAQIPGTDFKANGYTKSGLMGQHSLNGGEGFNGNSPGFANGDMITSVVEVGPLTAGDEVQIQFYGAWDQFAIGELSPPEWNITAISVVPEPSSLGLGLIGLLGLIGIRRRRRVS